MIAISYRREDSLVITGRLYDRLLAKFGKDNVFMDFASIRPGLDFRSQITQTIERCKLVIAMIGPNWLGEQNDKSRRIDEPSDFVRLEIAHALKRDIPIIPILINNTAMPKPEMLPADLQTLVYRHALPLDGGLDFHQHADRIISGICDVLNISPLASEAKQKTEQAQLPKPLHSQSWVLVGCAFVSLAGVALAAWFIVTPANSKRNAELDSREVPAPNSGKPLEQITKAPVPSPIESARPLVEPKNNAVPTAAAPALTPTASPASPTTGFPQLPSPISVPNPPSVWSGEVFPQTRTQLLQVDDVRGWDSEKLRYAINEMYARGGYDFRTPEIKAVFMRLPWYRQRLVNGRTQDEAAVHLSALEQANLEFLQKLRGHNP